MWRGWTELAMSMSAGTGDTTCNFLSVFDELIFQWIQFLGFNYFFGIFFFLVRILKINESPSFTLSQKISVFVYQKKKSLFFTMKLWTRQLDTTHVDLCVKIISCELWACGRWLQWVNLVTSFVGPMCSDQSMMRWLFLSLASFGCVGEWMDRMEVWHVALNSWHKKSWGKSGGLVEMRGIDPRTSRMLSERSTIWATSPFDVVLLNIYITVKEQRTSTGFSLHHRSLSYLIP